MAAGSPLWPLGVAVCAPNHTPLESTARLGCRVRWLEGRAGAWLWCQRRGGDGARGPSWLRAYVPLQNPPTLAPGGRCRHSRTPGQVQIVLKHRRAGFRWRQRALHFSGERFRRRLRPSPGKNATAGGVVRADLGAAVEESRPQIYPGCQTAFSGSFPSCTGPSDLRASVFGRCRSAPLGPA